MKDKRAVLASLPVAMERDEVIRELVQLAKRSRWRRLEASTNGPHKVGGYCITPDGQEVRTEEARSLMEYPEAIGQLVGLLIRSGWQRLEAVRYGASIRGWCVTADGTGVHIPETHRGD